MDSRPFGKILGSELKEEDGTQLPRSLASLQHQLELLCSYRPEADIGVSREQPLARPGGGTSFDGVSEIGVQLSGRCWLGKEHSRSTVVNKDGYLKAYYTNFWKVHQKITMLVFRMHF
jgi:hypothetical protein